MIAIRQLVTFDQAVGNCILEEGLTHELWRLLFFRPDLHQERWWRIMLRWAGPTVIVLDVSPQRAVSNIHDKSKWGPVNTALKGQAIESLVWEKAISAYKVLLEALRDDPGINLVFLQAEKVSVPDTCAMIAQRLSDRSAQPDL